MNSDRPQDRPPVDKFGLIHRLAVDAAGGEEPQEVYRRGLRLSADLVGLAAAALVVWNRDHVLTLNVSHARSEDYRRRLDALERELFDRLRQTQQLASAYMSFEGDPPVHAFTLPLRYAGRTYGAVIGLQEGPRTIVSEEALLETLAAVLALTWVAGSQNREEADLRSALTKERKSAVIETAVTVNHEVNNPLTAILGNVQLLLLKRDDLDDELKAKLRTIEQSALKIKDVTQKLMRLTSPRSIDYSDGTKMIDLNDGGEEA
ncbi:MAG TPA: histidine kinase dimerization/phospho-acceptor domain-containing protein [candidate division Zixibacteria bacterium]|nr:hypothetical protein [candidate division Zixibacteria bacterium]MDD4917036.1 histidine kinase dimerization/phospho-acceptor domain-containing protein [candidate division Zixibacteria bacterium]MDM7972867.1 histidine kinase dimerization/phospho-acceptor domain-containing protein [candidate division Zixibacteria bacterium]HOD67468.1 histidine kinase dimerization/phospho-acceptor domain-containing protein [candidate division Zixibacteria bacterium]HOZ08234.1 histidine kinase dimerization/phosph